MSTNIKAENIKAWALVDKQYGDVVECHFTRDVARQAKRELEGLGVATRIAKLSFSNFVR